MELYLNWLNQYDRREGEETPIGVILCTDANRKVAELLELDKSGIAVAEYWTKLPPKEQFESKIQEIIAEAKKRIERRKMLGTSNVEKQVNYFLEESSDETDEWDLLIKNYFSKVVFRIVKIILLHPISITNKLL